MPSFVTSSQLNGRVLAAPSERRAGVRYACKVKGAWRPLGSQGAAWEAVLQDVSEGGINLLMDSTFRKGTILAVKLDCPMERFKRPVLVRVAHCKQEEDGVWSVGCSFTARLKKRELLALLQIGAMQAAAEAPESPPKTVEASHSDHPSTVSRHHIGDAFADANTAERRRTPRRAGGSVSVTINRAGSSERPVEGWIVNRSLGGLCVCSPKAFEAESILKIRVKRGNLDPVPPVEVRVRGAREEGQRWMMHCQFTIQPSAHTLMMFG